MNYSHTPVLLKEVIDLLQPKPGENFVDATLGGGGYSMALLEKIAPKGKVLSIDLDVDAIEAFELRIKDKALTIRSTLVHGNFSQIDKIAEKHTFTNINGIVADIGLSSYELDEAGRGISFQKKEPLDMRFDQSAQTPDAKFIINRYTEKQLTDIFWKFSEEKHTSRIVKNILRERAKAEIHYTTDLVELIKNSLPKPVQHKFADSARRIFQALRIAVNHELENLETFLPKALDLLNPGGRLAIVAFHSLEDRMVKNFFKEASRGCVCPIDFPQCRCGKNPIARIVTKKPVIASEEELEKNPRSKPAKLRVLQKL